MLRLVTTALIFLTACKGSSTESTPEQPSPGASAPAKPAATGAADPAAPARSTAPLQPAQGGSLERLADGRVALGPFSLQVPDKWQGTPASGMRAAQFELPAAAGGEAEVIVYYFGERGAGSVQANIDRWLSQFTPPGGRSAREAAKIEKAQYAGQDATLVSISGRYVTRAMPGGGQAVDKPGQSLLAAIVESPKGPYYFRLIGDEAAVAAHTPAYRELLASLKLR